MFALTAFLSGFVLADRPWLPSEAITVNGETVTGYVLSEDSGQLVILRDDSRVAIWLEEPVGSREFCAVQIPSLIRYTIAAPPLLSLGMRHGDYPECP